MPFYYIKNGGTAINDQGRYASKQTGAFSDAKTNDWGTQSLTLATDYYYDSIDDVFGGIPTTPVAAADFVLISSAHLKTYLATTTLGITACNLVSVDDSVAENYLKGAEERTTGNFSITLVAADNHVVDTGVDFTVGRDLILGAGQSRIDTHDCTLKTTESKNISAKVDGLVWIARDCIIDMSDNEGFVVSSSEIYLYGCVFVNGGAILDAAGSGSSGASAYLFNCDLFSLSAANPLVQQGGAWSDDIVRLRLERCKLPASVTVLESAQVNSNVFIDFESCTDPNNTDDHDAYYYEYHYRWEGEWETVTGAGIPVRNSTYDGVNKMSLEMATSTNSQKFSRPIRAKLATIANADLTSESVYTVHFTCANALDDHDFWVEVVANNDTDQALGEIIRSTTTDIMATPTAYIDNGDTDWTNPLANTFDASVTIPAKPAVSNSVVEIWVCLAAPSETVNVEYEVAIT